MSTTYLDVNENPAIRLAFGYSLENDKTNKVLAVREGRVVILRMTDDQFKTAYVESGIPFSVSIRALESIARNVGCDLSAHRTILHFMNASVWRLRLVDYQLRIRELLTGGREAD